MTFHTASRFVWRICETPHQSSRRLAQPPYKFNSDDRPAGTGMDPQIIGQGAYRGVRLILEKLERPVATLARRVGLNAV